MTIRQKVTCALLACVGAFPLPASADTYVIPFSEIREAIDTSNSPPDVVIRAYLASLIRDELDDLGFDIDGGLILDNIPIDEISEVIETDCNFFRPYLVHANATTATVTIADSSSLTIQLDSIRSVTLLADLIGSVSASTDALVRWGQDVPFGRDCATINTDHGRIGISVPFNISLDLALELTPRYDSEVIGLVVDKQAVLTGQAQIGQGNLFHDFGTASLTDILINIFEDEMLKKLQENGKEAVAEAIAGLNLRLDGLDENGVPDPSIEAFNGPSTFILEVDEEDEGFVRDLLAQFGIPDLVISMLDDRGVEILLQLVILEGAERDAYLASLGATLSCTAVLNNFETSLDVHPIYALYGQACEVADHRGPNADAYFSDAACTDEIAFRVTDEAEYCAARFGEHAGTLLGNAGAWVADDMQPNDPLPDVSSRSWTTIPSTQLDIGVVSIQGNHQPYLKQLAYKSVDVARGTGSCELEMRVYKSNITEQGLKPLVALHGGTWRHRGFSFLGLEAGISQLTERGFIVFAPFYRLVGESDGNDECNAATWHEVTEDVESALDWVRQNGAALGAANERVSVYGQSAGAHLAAWLAAHRAGEVRKALLYYAPVDALEFLAEAAPMGGRYDVFRDFGLNALSRLFGAPGGSNELHLERIGFGGLTVSMLRDNWQTLIPDTVFDLRALDPQMPPLYLARCAAATQTNLAAVNLSMPPPELTQCLKEDLSNFLIENSFNHLLRDEVVPVHFVHGSADTLVPYQQAVELCGEIDNRVLATDIVDALTTYTCGVASEVQIVKDADHALELGVCLDSLCPAGTPGGDTRGAVAEAIEKSYAWLQEDPPAAVASPPPVANDSPPKSGSGSSSGIALFGLMLILLFRRGRAGAMR